MYHLYEEDVLKIKNNLALVKSCSKSLVQDSYSSTDQEELQAYIEELSSKVLDIIQERWER